MNKCHINQNSLVLSYKWLHTAHTLFHCIIINHCQMHWQINFSWQDNYSTVHNITAYELMLEFSLSDSLEVQQSLWKGLLVWVYFPPSWRCLWNIRMNCQWRVIKEACTVAFYSMIYDYVKPKPFLSKALLPPRRHQQQLQEEVQQQHEKQSMQQHMRQQHTPQHHMPMLCI